MCTSASTSTYQVLQHHCVKPIQQGHEQRDDVAGDGVLHLDGVARMVAGVTHPDTNRADKTRRDADQLAV